MCIDTAFVVHYALMLLPYCTHYYTIGITLAPSTTNEQTMKLILTTCALYDSNIYTAVLSTMYTILAHAPCCYRNTRAQVLFSTISLVPSAVQCGICCLALTSAQQLKLQQALLQRYVCSVCTTTISPSCGAQQERRTVLLSIDCVY
jgi:hypothetical protein